MLNSLAIEGDDSTASKREDSSIDIADQRLIYAGHLLDDVQLLTDVFGISGPQGSVMPQSNYQHSGPYTIHLACTSKSYVSPSQRSTRSDNQTSNPAQPHLFSSQIPNPMMQDPRLANMQSPPNQFNSSSGIPPEFYALHQLYVEQMTAYMRTWNLAYGIRDANFVPGSAAPRAFNYPNVNVQANNPQPQAAPNPPPQNERGNFGGLGGFVGGPNNDDDENQRDLLDWAYTLSRVVLILSVVYFYSNFTRFLLVVIFTAAIAIFQRRPFQNQEAQPGANDPAERPGNNPVDPAPVPAPGEQNRNEREPNADNQDNAELNNNHAANAGINAEPAVAAAAAAASQQF
ncbi:Homocysteine-responsive endoplasmic reticulum-resident ubiquitin-like domain member 2 protein [Orchesella cincta]|uniref:Homocysteine-responsive endoplasmic reticulum-resident ubiquitin-like domain member 2 protein n=1 Tax=Orchesella cincta TaxID=48709 RepID=A0A1D2N1A9_ORCCI|nr:Homocysteine-responsive endoplasmic reticulum-resident ubiquitin-like domain member 2 protein [Orchesella cincta]